jgi:hypothetical protein
MMQRSVEAIDVGERALFASAAPPLDYPTRATSCQRLNAKPQRLSCGWGCDALEHRHYAPERVTGSTTHHGGLRLGDCSVPTIYYSQTTPTSI